jgi:hypothetical protein
MCRTGKRVCKGREIVQAGEGLLEGGATHITAVKSLEEGFSQHTDRQISTISTLAS